MSCPELRASYSSRHFYVLFIGVLPLTALSQTRQKACLFPPWAVQESSWCSELKISQVTEHVSNHILFCRF